MSEIAALQDALLNTPRIETTSGEGVPPVFGDDYWLGDTIACTAYLGGEEDNPLRLTGRVTDAVVTELDSGQVAVKVSCAPEVSATGVTGAAITVLAPENSEA